MDSIVFDRSLFGLTLQITACKRPVWAAPECSRWDVQLWLGRVVVIVERERAFNAFVAARRGAFGRPFHVPLGDASR